VLGRILRAVRTPLTLLILLGLLCYGAYWGWTRVVADPLPAPQPSCVPQRVEKGKLSTNQVTVNVFNGGKVRGLAGDVANDLKDRGYKTAKVTDTQETITTTVIVGANVNNPEVKLVLSFFKKAKARADRRTDRSVDVLVGDKYSGFDKGAKTSISVAAKTVCLPPTAAPSGGA